MRRLGVLVRLQIQLEPLKRQEGAHRRFDPGPIRPVDSFVLGAEGVEAWKDGLAVLDVHHPSHPRTRHRGGANGLSIGFSGHYRRMREHFGARVGEGIAGENLIVACDEAVALATLAGGLEIRTAAGPVRLGSVRAAEPCEPFTTFLLGVEPGQADPGDLKAGLQFLRHGTRGFYARLEGPGPVTLRVGDELWVAP